MGWPKCQWRRYRSKDIRISMILSWVVFPHNPTLEHDDVDDAVDDDTDGDDDDDDDDNDDGDDDND